MLSSNQGVSNEAAIEALRTLNVLEVMIDQSRSKQRESLAETTASNSSPENTTQNMATKFEKKESIHQIQKLYTVAKEFQSKLLNALKNGEVIDIAPIEEMADRLVYSIFKNRNALLLLSQIRKKDTYLMEHSLNVGILLANFGRFLNLGDQIIKNLVVGGLLHDTGKVMVPDEILHKPGRLTADEFSIMKQHVDFSLKIMNMSEGIGKIIRTVAENHHEKLDGSGYPRGLKGNELCLVSRMSAIVDVFDALTADRCYKKGMQASQAFRILLQGCGTQFDTHLVNNFIKCMGIYPTGSLVKLKSGKLAIVLETRESAPLKPVVKIIYSAICNIYLDVKVIDLEKTSGE